jgi:hypothetical protein
LQGTHVSKIADRSTQTSIPLGLKDSIHDTRPHDFTDAGINQRKSSDTKDDEIEDLNRSYETGVQSKTF